MKTGSSRSGYGASRPGSDAPSRPAVEFPRRAEPDGAERLAALSALVDSLSQQIEVMEGAAMRAPVRREPPQPASPAPASAPAATHGDPDPRHSLEGRFDALGRQLDDRQSERLSGIETRLAAIASQLAAVKAAPAAAQPAPAVEPPQAVRAPAEEPARPQQKLTSLQAAIAEISSRQKAIDHEASAPANHFDAIAIEDAIAALRDDIALLGRRVSAEARRNDEASQTLKTELAARMEALTSRKAADPAPAPDAIALLRQDLAEIRQSLDLAARETTLASIESGYGHIIERLDDIVRREPETDRFDRLAHEIAQLAASIETSAPSREVETELEDIRNAVASLSISRSDAVSAAVERQISSLHAAIDTLAARPAPPVDLSGIEREIDSLRRDLDGLSRGADPLALIRLEKQIAGIRSTIDEIDPRPAGLDPTALSRLEDRIDALAGRFDALAELPTLRAPDALDGLRTEITQLREDFARPSRLDAIEEQMQALVRRLDASARRDDHQALAQLEAQVGALAEQFSALPGIDAIGRVEDNLDRLQDLIGHGRQDTIEAARDAARSVVRELANSLPARNDEALIRGLREDMRQLQEAAARSDRQTHETLEAVHNTLAKVVNRIAQLEFGGAAEAPSVSRRELHETVSSLPFGLPEADRPLAPGSGQPVLPPFVEPDAGLARTQATTAPQQGRPGDRKADFIAAARRAAQAAQTESAEAVAGGGDARPSTLSRIGDALRSRRRPIVLAIAAIVLAIGAMQLSPLPSRQARENATPTDPVATGSVPAKPARDVTPSSPAPAAPSAPAPHAMIAPSADGAGALAFTPPDAADGQIAALASDPPPASGFTSSIPDGAMAGSALETAAAKGDAVAAFEVARRLADGSNGQPRDARLAAEWYERSAKAGFALAQYRIGSLYERGEGVPRDLSAAQAWYAKASEQGNARAAHNLAVLLSEGATAEPDYVRAVQYFTQAANWNVADSQYNLGVLYARGLGVGVDLVQSYKWFALAAQQGDRDAGKRRDEVAKAMTADALAAARAAVQTFKPKPLDTTANSEPAIKPEWKPASPQTTMRDTKAGSATRG
ncbi:hypothetical protein [Kaistia nematophila]|uniref:Localization factor PodJL n=1 Tax=Kaistia nematophila TaxID=2994654 RepID=A0A9X3DYN1_9HYPH|nr:hypothetical protein [Kaistia nematophila]MCX5568374.1 hypothetical protein [Kaistia nematophila]